MTIKYLINLTMTSLKYNKGRTVLNILSIVVGMTALSIVLITGSSVNHSIKNQAKKDTELIFSLFPVNYELPMELDYFVFTNNELEQIASEIKEVETIEHQVKDTLGRVNNSDVKMYFDDNIEVIEGVNFDNQVDNVAIATNFSFNETEEKKYSVGDKISINSILYTIIGLQDPFSSTANELTLPSYTMSNFKDIQYSNDLKIVLNDISKKQEVIKEVTEKLNANIKDYRYETLDFDASISSIVSVVTMFLALLGSISLVVSMIGIVNMMYVSVLERQGEIAILRAIGLERNSIISLFLFESIFMMIVSAFLSLFLASLISILILLFAEIDLYVSIYMIVGVLIFSIILGILTGILPANKAAKKNTSDILK
ncbi:MAG: ABC transporter permease [Mycoplasmatales bacterium]